MQQILDFLGILQIKISQLQQKKCSPHEEGI